MTIRELLTARYAAPEWAVFFEVHDQTGGARRRADAIAVNLWRSRRFEVVGIEIKSHRSDWLRELKNPAKAEPILRYCDRWVVVADRGVVKLEELPAAWGLLEVRGDRLFEVRKGPPLEPDDLDRRFLAALLRRAHEQAAEVMKRSPEQVALDAAYRRGAQDVSEAHAAIKAQLEKALKTELDRIDEFQKASGVSIGRYASETPAKIGAAVRAVLEGPGAFAKWDLARAEEHLRTALTAIDMLRRRSSVGLEAVKDDEQTE